MLTVTVEFLRGVFEGADPDNADAAEWPPSWMRLFSAFVDAGSVDTTDNDEALRYLERIGAPTVDTPEAISTVRGAYVPTNDSHPKYRSSTLLNRTNSERRWPRTALRDPVVTYAWPDIEATAEMLDRLQRIARRIPYVGRSTSPAIVTVTSTAGPPSAQTLVPTLSTTAARADVSMRVPFEGALDALRHVHRAREKGLGGDPWEVGQRVDYGFATPPVATEAPSPYRTMLMFRIADGFLDGRNTAAIARYTRAALMSRVGNPPLAELHGRDRSVDRVSIVGLPDVGFDRSDGHILGVAICIPRSMSDAAYATLEASLPATDSDEPLVVTAGRLGLLSLERITPATALRQPRGLRRGRWTSPSARWVTAAPLVTDHFLKRGDSISEELARLVAHAGLPPLRQIVAWDRRPLAKGALDLRPEDTLRRSGDRSRRPYFHVEFELERPVWGPVVLGSMRHYGLGLCIPVPDSTGAPK